MHKFNFKNPGNEIDLINPYDILFRVKNCTFFYNSYARLSPHNLITSDLYKKCKNLIFHSHREQESRENEFMQFILATHVRL